MNSANSVQASPYPNAINPRFLHQQQLAAAAMAAAAGGAIPPGSSSSSNVDRERRTSGEEMEILRTSSGFPYGHSRKLL